MKNKEIEELLNELKEVTNSKKLSSTYCITNKHWQLLLSYIEQLENNRDKAIEYINDLRDESAEREGFYNCFPDDLYIADIEKLLNILKGDSDEQR